MFIMYVVNGLICLYIYKVYIMNGFNSEDISCQWVSVAGSTRARGPAVDSFSLFVCLVLLVDFITSYRPAQRVPLSLGVLYKS